MFGIGGFELFIILLFGFLVFGPDKLPEIAKTLGAALRKFKDAQTEMEAVIKDEVLADPEKKPAPSAKAGAASTESFAERKARYDEERRAKIEANREAMKKQAAQMAQANKAAAEVEAQSEAAKRYNGPDGAAATGTASKSESAAAAAQPKPALSPDELFGNKPIKPASQKVVSLKDVAEAQAADPVPIKTLDDLGMAPEKTSVAGAAVEVSAASAVADASAADTATEVSAADSAAPEPAKPVKPAPSSKGGE